MKPINQIYISVTGNEGTSFSRSVVPRAKNLFVKQYPNTKAICYGVDLSLTEEVPAYYIGNKKVNRLFKVEFRTR